MSLNPIVQPPIRFGTDGWRGLIADDFTFARLLTVAPIAAQVLAENFADSTHSNTIVIGYDRRFLSSQFAQRMAGVVAIAGFDVRLAEDFAPTPAFSWEAYAQKALGALVITASHNPPSYSGLKIKGAFGGSVGTEITQQVEAKLNTLTEAPVNLSKPQGQITLFDPWQSYLQELRTKVDLGAIKKLLVDGDLAIFIDVMHGATAGGFAKIFDLPVPEDHAAANLALNIVEINSNTDPLFGGVPPEPLPRYLSALSRKMRAHRALNPQKLSVGFVFDGDGDRIAAVDSEGNFLSSQILIPILISHLAERRGSKGEVIKTISGLDLIAKVAELYKLPLYETPIGYKYIAERMLSSGGIATPQATTLIGGEESGGIGYGSHIPERDALLSALYLLEAIAKSQQDLSHIYKNLQDQTGYYSHYDRIDQHLPSLAVKDRLLDLLKKQPLTEIAGRKVIDVNQVDGFKYRLVDNSWLLIRFSGTEPVLRLYCEAPSLALVKETLAWIVDWVKRI